MMTMSLNDTERKLKELLAALEKNGEPVVIVVDDNPKAVLLRYQDYDSLVQDSGAESYITHRPDISGGEPILRGTRISVRHVVERVRAGETVEEILAALPHLTAAQVHAALAYYYDHRSELDRLMDESRLERVVADQGLKLERVAEGVAVVHKAAKQFIFPWGRL